MKIQLASPVPTAPYVLEEDGRITLHFEESQIQSQMFRDDPTRLALLYTRVMLAFRLFQPRPARLLLIGLGGGSIVKHLHVSLPHTHVSAVEISAEVLALRDTFAIPPDDSRLTVIHGDGAEAVRSGRFDVILVDGFDADGQAPSLCTPAFYADCRDHLTEEGVLVVNIVAASSGKGAYVRRIREAFAGAIAGAIAVVPTGDDQNRIVFAWKGPAPGQGRVLESEGDPELAGIADAILASYQAHAGRPGR